MTRNQKLAKLASAIRDMLGATDETTGKWIRPPKPSARARVIRWLNELGLPLLPSLETIQGFKHVDQFNAWFRGL